MGVSCVAVGQRVMVGLGVNEGTIGLGVDVSFGVAVGHGVEVGVIGGDI